MMMTTADHERLRSLIAAHGYSSVPEAMADLIDQAVGNLPEGQKRSCSSAQAGCGRRQRT
jgi:hypothetical protein